MADDDDELFDELDVEDTCPSCSYRGYEYDPELCAWVHDYCGYYVEADSKWAV